jgi:hypothetical protein
MAASNAFASARLRTRLGDEALLQAAGADLVVTSLDEVAVDALVVDHFYRT